MLDKSNQALPSLHLQTPIVGPTINSNATKQAIKYKMFAEPTIENILKDLHIQNNPE